MKKLSPEREHELAEALSHYTDPNDPEYDAEFDKKIRQLRPDWFQDQESPPDVRKPLPPHQQ
jgi:hypothetical protein